MVASFAPKSGKLDYVYQKLKKNGHANITVYLKQNIPERFYYKNNHRIMPITIIAEKRYINDKVNY